ncbi:DUF6397 family protein [Streptomyces coeruleoprunus]|uniref:DUF6397 family protein n=1 Tax=Streptomyces coeruleoprunus TaxID=285563 RepID=A0ABV9X992_9ACTN
MSVEYATRTVARGRAAQELELRRGEFELAVHLGHVRTVPAGPGGRPRVAQEEIDRLRAEEDFPDGLRDRIRTVGTAEAARLATISADRFTRLARAGYFRPVAFYLNRYRAVVWLYLACEVRDVASRYPELLTGRVPAGLRALLEAGADARPRTWRARRTGLLLRQTDDLWEKAAVLASCLGPAQLAELVTDPYERAHIERLRPPAPQGRSESATAREIVERLLLADEPNEIRELRTRLITALAEARADRPAPRPDGPPATPAAPDPPPRPDAARRRRTGLLARFRLRRARVG